MLFNKKKVSTQIRAEKWKKYLFCIILKQVKS